MHASQDGSPIGEGRYNGSRAGASPEIDDLRATYRRQAHVIDALTGAVATLRAGAAGLKNQNAELRAVNDRLRRPKRERRDVEAQAGPFEVRLALDPHAPAAARAAVGHALRHGVPAAVLDRARLLVSELTTNSVSHSGATPDGAIILRVERSKTTVRLEVEDCGRGDGIAARQPDVDGGGGFGLNLVHSLSERWGVERAFAGPTRVWARLPLTTVDDGAA
jgi:anti-sigma regulatory factor (Ser/Thr protein kinase)